METVNGRKVGVWLDHREAVVVELTGAKTPGREPEVRRISSEVEDQVKGLGHQRHQPPQGGAQTGSGAAEAKRLEHRREQEIRSFLRSIADAVEGAAHVAVLGPGEAPGELERFLAGDKRFKGARVRREGADGNLREGEAVNRLREMVGEPAPRVMPRGANN